MECERCGSSEFNENDGFFFCRFCQAQSQGFAKEEDESEVFAVRKEVRINKESRKRKQKTQDEVASDKFSLWTNFEAYNELYICWIEDFFCILDQLRLRVDKELFKSIAMKIWFKYLKESEAAFSREDHLNIVKLHPLANQRDRFQVNQSEELQSEKLPYFKMNYLNTKKRFLVLKYSNIQKFKESDDFEQLHKNFLNIFNETQANKAPYQAKKGLDSVYFELSKQSFNRPDVFADLVNEMIKGNDVTETVAQLRMERQIEKMNQLADSQNSEANPSTNPIDLIPYKSKKLLDLTSEEALNNSPYYSCTRVDHITKGKLLACLYLTIRVYNINIFPSDLIRWAFEGLIRYHNPLGCFPEHWELRISDTKKYCCYKCIDYPNFQTMIKNLLVHCGLDMTLFSSPDCYEFIRRLIKDLNLPKGLNLIVKQRYGDYIERQQIDAAENSLNIPHYEYVGIAVVLLTLRDLFDLFGKNNAHYDKFKNSESITDLFIWSEWFHFSKLCLSLIKIFYFKRRSFLPNTSTIDFDQFLSSHDNFDHQDQLLVKHRRKTRNRTERVKLQESFSHLFFNDLDYQWSAEIDADHKKGQTATFYPLTAKLKSIVPKISSSRIRSIISTNFRSKLITPYVCKHQSLHHRRSLLFPPGSIRKNSPEPISHLLELMSFSTLLPFKKEAFISIFNKIEEEQNNLL